MKNCFVFNQSWAHSKSETTYIKFNVMLNIPFSEIEVIDQTKSDNFNHCISTRFAFDHFTHKVNITLANHVSYLQLLESLRKILFYEQKTNFK